MPDLYWDIEARSAASLQMCGAWRYAADPTTSVLCVCYAVDDGAAQVELCRACRHHIARRTDHRCHQIAKGPPPSTKASPCFFARGPLLLTMEFAPVLLRSHPARRPAISGFAPHYGDDIASIRKWFLQSLTNDPKGMWDDLTPFEQAFLNQIFFAFQAWQREREERANNPENSTEGAGVMGKHGAYPRVTFDHYPTPDWAIAALTEHIEIAGKMVWEPCAGSGQMAEALKVGGRVRALQRHMDRGYPLNAVLDFTNGAELQIPFYGLVTNPAYGHGDKIAERLITAGLHHIAGGGGKFLPLATLPSPKTPPPPSSRVAAAGSINLKP